MANNKMLIDATHPEETRVVVLRAGRVEEFDYESAARKLLRGNIYLAKVTRVEPSLQAAFVDYGGNRHGFLAFNEIHPDYYQIPMADRQALLEEEAAQEAEEEAAADARAERLARRQRREHGGGEGGRQSASDRDRDQSQAIEELDGEGGLSTVHSHDDHDHDRDHDHHGHSHEDDDDDESQGDEARSETREERSGLGDDTIVEEVGGAEIVGEYDVDDEDDDQPVEAGAEAPLDAPSVDLTSETAGEVAPVAASDEGGVQVVAAQPAEAVEQVGSEDALEELPARPRRRPRSYKIQEVIKRRQVILVQVVKEERGNKGAALTTYLSLAGRYTVLMPNTARGGGISRKITNPQDRKRLKAIAQELEVPEGMGLIIRTAGAARTKQEIKRDFEYLLRLWESVRDLTLQSTAPSLVYEEGNLIKRSIRDLYNKDVEEIIVAGDHAHKDAKDFMRMLMPSHAKNVLQHQDPEPLFTKYGIERQLNAMFSPYVTLKSGGYLVINQTEALVAVDVNSGKATREFSIEETAVNTNLEAADEIARQVKLRDLAGLIVIDFIDMEEKRNNRAVERRLKDALRFDRARIQLGRISHFGLMEMSRQRMRTGVLEGSTSQCPHCQGTGIIRSVESVALAVLRGLEDALLAGARTSLIATTTSAVALYILNNKRHFLNEMESRNGVFVSVQASDKLQGANFVIEKGQQAPVAVRRPDRTAVNMDWGFEGEEPEAQDGEQVAFVEESDVGEGNISVVDEERGDGGREGRGDRDGGRDGGRRRRRRRGRRGAMGDRPEGRDDRASGGGSRFHSDNDPGQGDADDGDYAVGGGRIEVVGDDADGDEAPAQQARDGEGRGQQPGGRPEDGGRRRRRGRRGGRRGRDRNRGGQPNGQPGSEEGARFEGDVQGVDQRFDGDDGDEGDDRAPASYGAEPAHASGEQPSHREPVREAPRARDQEARSASSPSPASAQVLVADLVQKDAVVDDGSQEAAAPRRARGQATVSSEPKLERVVVTPDLVQAAEDVAATPTRKGWWQRKLGG